MKKLMSLAFSAVIAIALFSCNKSVTVVDPASNPPTISAHIYPNVTQPSDAALGSAIFSIGEKVVIYVPYEISNDEINTAELVISDGQGELITRKPLIPMMDAAAEGLIVPDELVGTQFLYGTIDVDDSFTNKNITLSIEIRGMNSGYSEDKIENAFSVLP